MENKKNNIFCCPLDYGLRGDIDYVLKTAEAISQQQNKQEPDSLEKLLKKFSETLPTINEPPASS